MTVVENLTLESEKNSTFTGGFAKNWGGKQEEIRLTIKLDI